MVSADERFVRETWVLVAHCDGSYRDYPRGTVLLQDVNNHWFDFKTWSAAAEFTRERLEQIRKSTIDVASTAAKQKTALEMILIFPWGRAVDEILVDWVQALCSISRIHAREQAALADLKRGMRS